MSDDTKKVGATKQPTEVIGPEGRSARDQNAPAAPLATGLDPGRTGVVERRVETAAVSTGMPVLPPDAAEKLDRAAAIRADMGKPKEQLEAERLEREANDAMAKAAEDAARGRGEIKPTTVAEAKFAAAPLVGADMSAGDHYAQKFGNDPRNPKLAPGLDPEKGRTVRLSRKGPDHPGLVYTDVHPEMVGDYLRAGWNRAT